MTEQANREIAADMAIAADSFIDALDNEQRAAARFSFDDGERRLWFYTPTDHGGLSMNDMDVVQQRLVWKLLASGLSLAGFNSAAVIVGQENVLDRLEEFTVDWGRERGRDPLAYWLAVFGTPGSEGRWAWRFGGHHVSVHFTIDDGRIVGATPCFLGSDPASAPLLGPHLLRPLGGVEDLGRELVRSLDGSQAAVAVASLAAPSDLITGNRSIVTEGDTFLGLNLIWRERFESAIDTMLAEAQTKVDDKLGITAEHLATLGFSAKPKGIAATALASEQRDLLRELLLTYVGRIHDDLADAEMARVDAGFDDLHFLWAGSTEVGEPHYYRVQGLDLFVEYDNATRDGNHVHTVWRDLSTDFGGDPLAAHYLGAPRGHGRG